MKVRTHPRLRLDDGRVRPDRAGMTMLELTVTLVILITAVGGTMGSISAFVALGDSSGETTEAYLAGQTVLEEMRAEDFGRLFALYDLDAADDPGGVVPGPAFSVAGLNLRAGDADGMQGSVLLPEDPANPGVLREDLDLPALGLPRDLNGDGAIDGDDRSGDYQLLPVLVRVEWRSRTGNRVAELMTVLQRR